MRVDKAVPQSGLETILKGTEVEGSFVAPVEVGRGCFCTANGEKRRE